MCCVSLSLQSLRVLNFPAGGERSFTTVCFCLALGDLLAAPFQAFDEWDCFMDAIARQASLRQARCRLAPCH